MIYFLARSVARGVGGYVGQLQTPAERQEKFFGHDTQVTDLWARLIGHAGEIKLNARCSISPYRRSPDYAANLTLLRWLISFSQ
jgi:hypothetical protein